MIRRGVSGLALSRIDGCITSSDRRYAWFKLEAQRWSFRSETERLNLIMSGASRYAQLVGRRLHMRVTTRPYPVERWARTLDDNTPNPLPYWPTHLRDEQIHVLGLTLAEKQVFLGVELLQPRYRRHASELEMRELEAIMSGPGFQGRAATPAELEYLLHRSTALGAPAPLTKPTTLDTWEEEDLAQFTDAVEWSCKPLDRSVRIVAEVDNQQFVYHVTTVTLGRMSTLDIPAMEPWLQRSDRLGAVEWSIIADVVTPAQVKHGVQDTLARIRSQVAHYAEHDLDAPTNLERQRTRALEIEDEISGANPLSTRVNCWVRAAVSGTTETEALDRARQLTDLYAPALTFARGADQYRTAHEFIPGEPLANVAHKRRMPVTTFSAGVPTVTAMVGDRVGIHVGSTTGSSERAVCWDTHMSMEVRERSGLTVVAGGLGAGKSVFLGSVAYQTVLRGIRTILLDPSGPLARLTELPELRERSRAVDLMHAAPGALSPYRVISEPRREQYSSEEDWQRAVALAAAQRRTLCLDTLLMLLPAALVDMPQTRMVLREATRAVGGSQGASARHVLIHLRKIEDSLHEHARFVANELDDIAEMPQTQLIFPVGSDHTLDDDDWLFQVLTMRGNVLPSMDKPRKEWSIEETLGVPLLHLASHLTTRHIYSRDMSERKLIGLDELHDLTRVGSGRSLVNRIARDTRKWNVRALLVSQNTDDSTTAGIQNFVDSAFIGRTTDIEAQRAALQVLGVETGVGYESVLGTLSTLERQSDTRLNSREFIFSDGDGGIERIQVHLPEHLRDVLDTTANPLGRHDPEFVNT